MKSFWDKFWMSWLGGFWTFFLPVELWAVFYGQDGGYQTLSDTTWRWEDLHAGPWWDLAAWGPRHWVLAIFMFWLTISLLHGSRRPVPDDLV